MRIIDADALKKTFCAECNHTISCEDCDIDFHFEHLAPTVDAEPVRHGHWIEPESFTVSCICSVCGFKFNKYEDDICGYPYCANCGAKMDEEVDNAEDFESIDKRFEALERKLDTLTQVEDHKHEAIEERFDTIEETLGGLILKMWREEQNNE